MRSEWDARARENARHYISNSKLNWDEDEFYRSGAQTVSEEILTDMWNICQGREPKSMRVLEIGCGAGRVTRALAGVFGEVHAVDVSGEMVAQARRALAGCDNAFVYQNNGADLAVVPAVPFHFAFSTCVFHHISVREVIYQCVREVGRLLEPGALFKFEVQGATSVVTSPGDTWLGVPFSGADAQAMADACGFEPRYQVGAGEERYWLWYFKR